MKPNEGIVCHAWSFRFIFNTSLNANIKESCYICAITMKNRLYTSQCTERLIFAIIRYIAAVHCLRSEIEAFRWYSSDMTKPQNKPGGAKLIRGFPMIYIYIQSLRNSLKNGLDIVRTDYIQPLRSGKLCGHSKWSLYFENDGKPSLIERTFNAKLTTPIMEIYYIFIKEK